MANEPAATSVVKIANDHVRVTEWSFVPGAATGWHRHGYDYVIVPLTSGRLKLVEPGGVERYSELKIGEPYAREEGVEHDVINANDFPFRFLEIELLR
jgi:quercetin dioxygenase-like cupin family protein